MFLFLLWICTAWSAPLNVAIDAGHGGTDNGAVSNGISESTIVLQVAKKLNTLLNSNKQFTSFLIRDQNDTWELHDRVRKAHSKQSQLFISIHANSSPDPRSNGMEIYFRNELEPDEEILRLANQENQFTNEQKKSWRLGDVQSITQDMQRSANTMNSYELSWHVVDNWKVPFSKKRALTIKQGPFYVIHQKIPSVLIEVGFVTHPKESKRLATNEYQLQLAQAIFKGLKDYKETLDKGQSKALK